nr:hypothetical protein [Tanacetum cinerariifolium]
MLKQFEDTNLCLNWEKSHFMVKEVLGQRQEKNSRPIHYAKKVLFVLGNVVEVQGSCVVMEMGEKMAEKGVGKKGEKHCAGHSVLNMNVTGVSTIGDFTTLVHV